MTRHKPVPAVPGKCCGRGEALTAANVSDAHVIPNALGGHLAHRGILCKDCNNVLNDLVDNVLFKAFGHWPALMDIPRDRKKHKPPTIPTRNGHKVRVDADGGHWRVDVKYDEKTHPDGTRIDMGAGDYKTIGNLIKRAAKAHPVFDPDEARKHAHAVQLNDGDQLAMNLDFSPPATFGAVVAALWLFVIDRLGAILMPWDSLLKHIESVQRDGGDYRYAVDGLPGLVGPEVPMNHTIVVRSDPKSGLLIGYVEFLGVVKVAGVLGVGGGGTHVEEVYVWDIMDRKDRSAEFTIDASQFNGTDWPNLGLGPRDVDALKDHFRTACEDVFVPLYQRRGAASAGSPDDQGAQSGTP